MRELAERVLGAEEAWIVGGAVRDELLGRPVVDLDIACGDPLRAARAYARQSGGAPFPLSERHGAWRVALDEGRTVDFTPLRGTIEDDLATRDFTVNAIAVPLSGGEAVDPFGGRSDLEELSLRHVSRGIFEDDPLRLLRAVRFVDQFGFRLVDETIDLIRASAHLAAQPAGERILAELEQLSAAGFRLLDELGLLEQLGGSVAELQDADSAAIRLPRVFGENLERFPLSNDQRRLLRTVLRAERPDDDSPRQIHRFRRATEPWALEALEFLGAPELQPLVEEARRREPPEPLVRGDELGLPPGPEVGRLLERIEEERAAGTISTREEALELAARERRP
jgi:tRNA nucleotidyltransferase/poly(A) polymerase